MSYATVVRSQVEIERNAANRTGPVIVALFVWQQLKRRGDCSGRGEATTTRKLPSGFQTS